MRKVLGSLGLLLTLASCYSTKDWACECRGVDVWGDPLDPQYLVIQNQNRKSAQAICEDFRTELEKMPEVASYSCDLREL